MPKKLKQEIDYAVILHSVEMINVPGLIRWYRQIWLSGDKQMAFLQMCYGFPQLPALMVMDILAGRIKGEPEPNDEPGIPDSLRFEWKGPQAESFDAYWLVKPYDNDKDEELPQAQRPPRRIRYLQEE